MFILVLVKVNLNFKREKGSIDPVICKFNTKLVDLYIISKYINNYTKDISIILKDYF